MATPEELKAAYRRLLDEGPNKGNAGIFSELLDEDVIVHVGLSAEPIRGREGVAALMARVRAAFPDLRIQVDELIAEGDRLVALVTNSGTNTGPMMGRPATGNRVTWTVVHIVRFKDGRIVEDRHILDRLSFFEQLGLAGPPKPS
jgi:steroid delta-isomerase-like uncharacterized protein